MRPARNPTLVLGPVSEDNRRLTGRVRCERLRCVFMMGTGIDSQVLDLSSTGLRVSCRHKLSINTGDSIHIMVESVAGSLALCVKVVWSKKRGFRRHEVGLTFGEPSPAIRAALNQIVRTSSVTNTMYRKDVA